MAYNNGKDTAKSSSLFSWKLLCVVFILVAVFGVVKLSADSCSRAGGEVSDEPAITHYEDLEIAREVDNARRPNSVRKDYEGFTVMFNPENHTPDWVGWELLGSEASGEISRANRFWNDPEIEGCAFTEDYRNAGYDRGHLCPAADQKWSGKAMSDCFVMTNIAPQDHALNSGAWSTLEKKERLWAMRDSALVIVAGPIYAENDRQRIGTTGIRVPSAFFKVMLAPYIRNPRAIGFIYPNMKAPGNMENYACTVDEVEELTGLDFFAGLPDSIENYVESHKMFKEWNQIR